LTFLLGGGATAVLLPSFASAAVTTHSSDDPAGHVRHGADDPVSHNRHGADNGVGHVQ